jgi:hypothetical protein
MSAESDTRCEVEDALRREDAPTFEFRDGQTAPEKIRWLLSEVVHGHGDFEHLAVDATGALPERLRRAEGMECGTRDRLHFERWLLPIIESCAIEQIAALYKRRASDPGRPADDLVRISQGAMTVLVQTHGPSPAAGAPWEGTLWERLAHKWADELRDGALPRLFREDLAAVIFRECCTLLIHGEEDQDPFHQPREDASALRRFEPCRGVPFRKYLEFCYLTPRKEKSRLIGLAASAYLMRAPWEVRDLDSEGFGLLVDFVRGGTKKPIRLEDLLTRDRRHWCLDAVVGVARAVFPACDAWRGWLLSCADERHESLEAKLSAAQRETDRAMLRFLLGLAELHRCQGDGCSTLSLLQGRLWLDLHGRHPREDHYLARRAEVLGADCLVSIDTALNRANARRERTWNAVFSAEPRLAARLEAYHDGRVAAWKSARMRAVARRIKAFLADPATTDAERAAKLAAPHPHGTATQFEGKAPKHAIAVGLLLKRGFRSSAASAILDAAEAAEPADPRRTGNGVDAVELDIWSETRALERVGEDVRGMDGSRARALLNGPEDDDVTIAPATPATFVDDVRKYLESFRVAALGWVVACKVDATLREIGRLLGCKSSKLYNRCGPSLRRALEGLLVENTSAAGRRRNSDDEPGG